MTRDEAVKSVHATSGRFVCSDEMANCLVDTWVALGMLKLDEPGLVKRVYLVAADALEERGIRCNSVALEAILSGANLKIVEK